MIARVLSRSPHRLRPEGCLQVFYNLVPRVGLLLVKFTQVLHLKPTGKGSRSHTEQLAFPRRLLYSQGSCAWGGYLALGRARARRVLYYCDRQTLREPGSGL